MSPRKLLTAGVPLLARLDLAGAGAVLPAAAAPAASTAGQHAGTAARPGNLPWTGPKGLPGG